MTCNWATVSSFKKPRQKKQTTTHIGNPTKKWKIFGWKSEALKLIITIMVRKLRPYTAQYGVLYSTTNMFISVLKLDFLTWNSVGIHSLL